MKTAVEIGCSQTLITNKNTVCVGNINQGYTDDTSKISNNNEQVQKHLTEATEITLLQHIQIITETT